MTKDEAMKLLHELLKPGDTVYTILRHVSASGMSRRISLIVLMPQDSKVSVRQIDDLCEAAGLAKHKTVTRYDSRGDSYKGREEGLVIGGCGMDMGFSLVYELGRIVWPNGTLESHGTRDGEADGGYVLRHEWL